VAGHWESHPERPLVLLAVIAAIDLQCRLARGEPATVEDYTGRFPLLTSDAALIAPLRAALEASRPAEEDEFATTPPPAAGAGNLEQLGPLRPLAGSSSADTLVGTVVGGISIVRMIAEGGMGRVYEGRQQKPRRPVAVKVMNSGITSANMLKRFEYEAQMLARLRHPGIAQIHSVGVHEVRGHTVPYFVMEYIPNAKTLTEYADDRKLSTHERLDLFYKVCDAVAHGHQKGIIHRDLKPENVLVDSSGQPKVIDFGVARSTDSDMALTTMQTDVGALIGTLQYMSPEQFDADPHDLDVRLDVYSLGVILYELLTGRPPYDVRQRAIFEIARVVREEEPTPISSLNKALRRDVAIIAGKCLQKDRNRRYSSATELAGDVSRYLAGEPITAAPPSFFDAVTRLARRHRAAATAVAGIAVSLVAAVIGISAFAIRAERAREEATRQTAVAVLERAAADRERDAAAQAQAAAEAAATKAKRQVYRRLVNQLDMALDGPGRETARIFFREAEAAYREAYGDDGRLPLELTLLGPELDGAMHVLTEHERWITCLAFSPDGTRLATGSDDKTARIWDTSTGESLAVLNGHEGLVSGLAFSPDGTRLATGLLKTVCIWDANTGESLAVLKGHRYEIYCLALSPDGTRLATGSQDQTARIWDTSTGESLAVLKGHEGIGDIRVLAFSPDGTRLATGANWDKTVRIWDARTGESLAVLNGHEGSISGLAFSPDGTRLATGSGGHVRIWDASTWESLAVLKGHEGSISGLAFSPDGTRLATGSWDKTVRIWGLSNAEISRNRLAAKAIRDRLRPVIDGWFTGDLAAVKQSLAAAKATMPAADWREAANMVLRRAAGE